MEKGRWEEDTGLNTTYFKIAHYGNPEIILNCHIQIEYEDDNTGKKYEIQSDISIIEKGIEVFIPLYTEGVKDINLKMAEATYSTTFGERIIYRYNLIDRTEGYWLQVNSQEKLIFQFALKNSSWLLPNKIS